MKSEESVVVRYNLLLWTVAVLSVAAIVWLLWNRPDSSSSDTPPLVVKGVKK